MGIDPKRYRGGSSQTWADWLSDDPVEYAFEPGAKKPPATRPVNVANNDKPVEQKTIALQLTMPRIKKPNLPYRRIALAGVVVFVLAGGGLVTSKLAPGILTDKATPGTAVLGEVSQTPDFEWLLPDGKPTADSNNVGAYDSKRRVVKYSDKIGGVSVTVSQQPLPKAFQDNPDAEVEKLAKGFSATEEIVTATPKAYLGTSVNGPQTVIFHKEGLLIFIQSVDMIDKPDWAGYITKLK